MSSPWRDFERKGSGEVGWSLEGYVGSGEGYSEDIRVDERGPGEKTVLMRQRVMGSLRERRA